MLTRNINLKTFKIKFRKGSIRKNLNSLINDNNQIIKSLTKNYKNGFKKKDLRKYKKYSNFRIIGMGGSSLGLKQFMTFRTQDKKIFIFLIIYNLTKKKKKMLII